MKNVLVLSAGRRVSLVRGFQDAMQDYGHKVYAADMRPERSAACHISDGRFFLPHCNDVAYPQALEDLCKAQEIAIVVPTIDTELAVLSSLKTRFAKFGTTVLVADKALIDACRDKRLITTFFEDAGLAVPTLYNKDAIAYPVLVKPYDGSLSMGVYLLNDQSELTDQILENPKNLYCQYIDHSKHTEYTNDLYYDRHGDLKCVLPRKRVEVRGGEVSKALADKNEIVDELFQCLSHVDGLSGCVNIQLFRNNDTHERWYIEMNPRFGGGYPLTRHAGADFQSWILREYLGGEDLSVFMDWDDQTMMLRFDDEVIVRP
jgi:carbamoyl-phosphate synthase large subunit